MSEEFKPVRITLSEEAFNQMDDIMKNAAFRSYSSTIEECIRATHDIIEEVHIVAGSRGDSLVKPTVDQCIESLNRIIMRMSRFTGRAPVRREMK